MKRRGALLRLAALSFAPLSAFGQSAARLPRIALVDTAVPTVEMALGKPYWGKSIAFERWSGAGDIARYPELARSAVSRQPQLIVSRSRSMTVRLAAATQSIPIVAVGTIPAPLRHSLSRPGRNVTGLQVASGDREIYSKAAQILQQVTPKNARAAWLGPQNIWESEVGAAAREGAKQVRLPLEPVLMATPVNEAAIRDGFSQVRAGKYGSLLLAPSTEFFPHRRLIVSLAIQARLPAIGANAHYAEEGLLISHGADFEALWTRAAHYVDRILKGTPAGDIPIEQPSTVQLAINMRTAKAIKVKIPAALLARANRIVE